MKKILSIFIIAFLLLGNITFAEFSIETKLSVQKQESYKKQINSVYKKFENKISKLNEEKQISNIEKIVGKIEIIVKNKISDKNNFVLSYLNYLLKEKLEFLKNNDEKLNLGEILKIEEKNNNTEVITNKIQEQNIQKVVSCDFGYINQNGTCIKKEESIINVNVNNQVTMRNCYIENGQGQETFQNNSWETCNVVSCNNSYHKEGNSCLSNQQSCNIDNGSGYKTWNGNWSSCNINSCNSGFENQNGKCLKSCTSMEHREGESCIANKVSCDIENGKGEKEWKNGNWGECKKVSCNQGYYHSKNNKCEKPNIQIIIKNSNNTIVNGWNKIANVSISSNVFIKSSNDMCFIDKNDNNLKYELLINNQEGYAYKNNGKICIRNSYLNRGTIGRNFEINISDEYPIDNDDLGKIIQISLIQETFQIESLDNYNIFNYGTDINYTEE